MPTQSNDPLAWRRPPRPRALSDPHNDWTDELCRALLAVKDADLTWREFKAFYNPCPAGTFEEVAYYLPLAIRYLVERRDGFGEFLDGFATWLSEHAEDLEDLGATDAVTTGLANVLHAWTSEFHIIHFDEAACRAKEWVLKYFNYVDPTDEVTELIHCLVRESAFRAPAERFVAELAASDSPTDAAWFLELARQQEEGHYRITGEAQDHDEGLEECLGEVQQLMEAMGCAEGIDLTDMDTEAMDAKTMAEGIREAGRRADAVKSEAILSLVRDQGLRERAAALVAGSDLLDPAASYWRDTRASLRLDRDA